LSKWNRRWRSSRIGKMARRGCEIRGAVSMPTSGSLVHSGLARPAAWFTPAKAWDAAHPETVLSTVSTVGFSLFLKGMAPFSSQYSGAHWQAAMRSRSCSSVED
jgi:hypothetical protein